jgi:hypothetical protein
MQYKMMLRKVFVLPENSQKQLKTVHGRVGILEAGDLSFRDF